MLLAIDIGNSQTSVGAFEADRLVHHWRIETRRNRTADEVAAILLPLFQQSGLEPFCWTGVAICSVVPSMDGQVIEFCRRYLDREPLKIHAGLPLGFSMNLATPQEVGADRLVNAAFAVRRLRLPCIVVDFGTATTFDLITAERVYEGGAIVPGLWMGAEALGGKTAKLPVIDLEFPSHVVGKTTVECIQSGILYGYCALIDGLLAKIQAEFGHKCQVALTGGLAQLFSKRLDTPCLILPDLTLEGIHLLYEEVAATASIRPFSGEPVH